jgi:hypothetical protein
MRACGQETAAGPRAQVCAFSPDKREEIRARAAEQIRGHPRQIGRDDVLHQGAHLVGQFAPLLVHPLAVTLGLVLELVHLD